MPDGGEILATRVAFLELKDERRLIQEGYELLDEKRVLLATEIMRQLRHYAALQAELKTLGADALAALEGAVGMHGFDALTVEPKLDFGPSQVVLHEQSFLGLRLVEATFDDRAPPPGSRSRPTTPEARACASVFRRMTARQSNSRPAWRACAGWCASTCAPSAARAPSRTWCCPRSTTRCASSRSSSTRWTRKRPCACATPQRRPEQNLTLADAGS